MRALVKSRPERGLWMEDVPAPEPGPNDVLVRVGHVAICGTDLHIYEWNDWAARTIPVPMAVGHEFMGVVAAFGSEVSGIEAGMRVSAEGHITCGHCRNCRAGRRHLCANTIGIGVNRAGAFADFVSIPAANIFPLPDDIPDTIGCILDPLGNTTHTTLAYDLVGEDVLITGAGPIGMMATAIARHVGARHIVVSDPNRYRLDIASQMGASKIHDPTATEFDVVLAELGMTEGFNVGLEMSGTGPALDKMIDYMITGGKHRAARHPVEGNRPDRLVRHHLQGSHPARHLRAPHVRDLVQDDNDAPDRSRCLPCHYPHVRGGRVCGCVRGDAFGPGRQGDPGVG